MKLIGNDDNRLVSNDEAKIDFGQAIIEIPTHISVFLPSYNVGGSVTSEIPINELQYQTSIKGGLRNEGEWDAYTTAHQNFHIYRYGNPINRKHQVVVCRTNGLGNTWFWFHRLTVATSILTASKVLLNDMMWDMLDLITAAFDTGMEHGKQITAIRYKQLFVDGRLKKLKIRGTDQYNVEIKDAK